MTGKADRRRPLVVVAVLFGAITAALVAPVIIGARRGEPIPGSIVRADSRDAVTINAPLSLFASPSVVLEKGTVALVSPAAESRVGALLRTLVLGGGADLVLDGARLVVDRRAGATGLAGSPAKAELGAAPADLQPVVASLSSFNFRSLAILDSTVAIDTGRGAPEEISVLNIEIVPAGRGLVSAKGQIEYRGERLDIDAAFERTERTPAPPIEVRASAKGGLATASFDGRLSQTDHGQIVAENAELAVSDLRGFADWLGASWPDGPGLGAFTAKGLLTLEERLVSFEHAEFNLDGNAATGTLMMKLGAERPSLEGTLAFATFDVAPYYASPSRPYAIALASSWLSAIPIPGLASRSFLTDMDADIRLSAGNVVRGPDRLGRCAASLSVKGGKLYGELAELELEQGGRGEGQFTVDATGSDPRYTLRAEMSDIDLATVVAPYFGPTVIDGSGDIRLDLSAAGSSEVAVKKSLAGKLSLEMSEGGRIGVDLAALPAAATASAPVAGWGAVGAGSTTLSSLTANFTAFRGVLTTDTVEAATNDRRIVASGAVDVDNSAVDLEISVAGVTVAPAADPSAGSQDVFKIHGPWSAPAITRAGPGKAAGATSAGADPG